MVTLVTSWTFTVAPVSESLPFSGGTGTVSITTNAGGCARTATTTATWISITSGASGVGSGDGAVGYSVLPNTTTAARTGTVKVAGKNVTVSQAAPPPCAYTVAPTSLSLPSGTTSGTITVTTTSACAWTAISNASWISVTSGASTGSGAVSYSVLPNTTTSARTSTLKVAGKTVTVTQAAAPPPCAYAVSPVSASIAAGGGSRNVSVTTTSACSWTAVTTVTWISVTGGASGTGSGTVTYAVAENTTGIARAGELTIAGRNRRHLTGGRRSTGGNLRGRLRAPRSTRPSLGNGWTEVLGDLQTAGRCPDQRDAEYVSPRRGAPGRRRAECGCRLRVLAAAGRRTFRHRPPVSGFRGTTTCCTALAGSSSMVRISRIVNGVETVLKSVMLTNPATNVFFRLEGTAEAERRSR